MGRDHELLEALTRQLPNSAGLVLGLGDLRTLAMLQERWPALLVVQGGAAARGWRPPELRRALRADPLALPLSTASLDGLIAVAELGRNASPAALLRALARHLRGGAWLLISEPLIRSATLRRLQGMLGGPRFARPPEEVAGLLLNAGFKEIGQEVVGARRPHFITRAYLSDV